MALRRWTAPLAMTLGLVAAAAPLHAGTGFDGPWTGVSKVEGAGVSGRSGASACADGRIVATVSQDRLRGSVSLDGSFYIVDAQIAPDGSVAGFLADDPLSGRFAGDSFSGQAVSADQACKRSVSLVRG